MRPERIRDRKWYPYAVAACIAVAFYVSLTHLDVIWNSLRTFGGFFGAVALGCVLAYLMNPLAVLFRDKLFRKITKEPLSWVLSIALTVVLLLLALLFLIGTLVPQLVDSVMRLVGNMDSYIQSLQKFLDQFGLAETLKLGTLVSSSSAMLENIGEYLSENISGILSASATAGKSVANWGIALILSVYLLSSKDSLVAGVSRLFRALLSKKSYEGAAAFLSRCDKILIRYIIYSLLDAAIIGVVNAVFMLLLRMQYIGLVSLVVAATNLIPTFGPLIGGVIGGFVLLLVNPVHALAFIAFTAVLQFMDGYVIKPKLFGDSLGVSGLLILTAVIVCGNMFGIIGILLAIPLAAILDFVYKDYLLPALEARRSGRE